MSIPITPEDFSAIGARFQSEDIIDEIDRLAPLATTDITRLLTRGYGPTHLTQLQALRASLVAEVGSRKQQRGSKKSSRKNEADAIHDGKLVLRSGSTIALAALTHRTPPTGEAPERTQQVATTVASQIDALGGRVGTDSAKLRTRLTSLQTILALPELAPAKDEAAARAAFLVKVQDAISALPELAEHKKSLQQDAKLGTSALDEIDGRAYTNLKTLTRVGRAYWNEHKNRARAAEYQLNNLHESTAGAPKASPTGAPAENAPSRGDAPSPKGG